jgi:hypothetical protein
MGFFTRKSRKEKLQAEYKKKMEESFRVSKINRKAGDALIREAEDILEEIKKEDEATQS